MDSSQENNIEVFISYAWGEESPIGDERMHFIDQLQRSFQHNNINLLIDKNEVTYKKSIRNFMEKIADGNYVILIISDKYLKSKYCMYEALQILEKDNYYDRIFPIVFRDAKIFEPLQILEYIKYWTDKIKELNAKIITIDAIAYSRPLISELELYFEIRRLITKFTDVISDLNTLTPEKIKDNNFEIILNSIKNTSQTKQKTVIEKKHYIDFVFCVDSNIQENNLELFKHFWLEKGFPLLREKFIQKGKTIDTLRGKLIELNNPSGICTKFYNLDNQEDLYLFKNKLADLKHTSKYLKNLKSLEKAIKSDWININRFVRHIIIVISENSFSENNFANKDDLSRLWLENEYMGSTQKRLALFAPDTPPWNFISETFEYTIHYPCAKVDKFVYQNEEDINIIFDIFTNSI